MKYKKIATVVLMAALLVAPCKIASAASVSFSNYTYTSRANEETWERIVYKVKADNEQNWYATLTSSVGLSSTVDRAMFTSGSANASATRPDSNLVPLYTHTTTIQEGYIYNINPGTKCWLNISGDQNNKTSYTVKVSGRYTS